jgi:hypothetical protein
MKMIKYVVNLLGLLSIINTQTLFAQDIKMLRLSISDMVYVPSKDRIYACTYQIDNQNKSKLYTINPYTARIEDSVQIGYRIRKLAISNDSKYLYISEAGSRIYRYVIDTKKIDLTIKLPLSRGDTMQVFSMRVLPNKSNTIVVSVGEYSFPAPNGITIYEDDRIVAQRGGINGSSYTEMALNKTGTDLYLYNREDSGAELIQLSVSNLAVVRYYANFMDLFSGKLKTDEDGFLYANAGIPRLDIRNTNGAILDGLIGIDIPRYSYIIQADPLTSLIYVVSYEYVSARGAYDYYLSTYSKTNYTLQKRIALPVPISQPYDMIHWGSGKLALFDAQKITFLRDCTPSVSTVPTIEQGETAVLCSDTTVTLSAKTGFNYYYWSTGDTGRVIALRKLDNVNYPLSVSVSATIQEQGCLSAPSKAILVNQSYRPTPPTITAFPNQQKDYTICQGDTVFLAVPASISNQRNFIWSNGARSEALKVSTSGTYTVKNVTSDGCESPPSEAIIVKVKTDAVPTKPVVTITGNTSLCQGESVVFKAPTGFVSYEWTTGETTNQITVNAPVQEVGISVRVTGVNGCKSAFSDRINVKTSLTPAKPTILVNQNCFGTTTSAESYQWYSNNTIIQGATKQFYLAKTRGIYSLKAINGRCASPFSDTVTY